MSKKGTLASSPLAIVALFALSTSHWWSLVVFLTLSLWNKTSTRLPEATFFNFVRMIMVMCPGIGPC